MDSEVIKWSVLSFDELTKMELYNLLQVRSEVFVVEQKCQYQDLDYVDMEAYHILGYVGDRLVAYSRIYLKGGLGCIGRVLVLEESRGLGFAQSLIKQSLASLKTLYGVSKVDISAQTYLTRFYESFGFESYGEVYMDAGVPHIGMVKSGL